MEYISLPLKDGSEYGIPYDLGEHYEAMFPNINVAQEFCSMLVWLEGNPSRRKTKRGMSRFIANWLIKSTRDSFTPSRTAMEAAVGRR
jgi:hypothetical protein